MAPYSGLTGQSTPASLGKFTGVSKLIPTELKSACTTLAVALINAFARDSDISSNAISFGIRAIPNEEKEIEIFFYDTAQGGAGYSTQMGSMWWKLLDMAIKELQQCSCDSRCYNCLSSYNNRFKDSLLNRYLAISLGEFLKTGEIKLDADATLKSALTKSLHLELEALGAKLVDEKYIQLDAKLIEISWIPSLKKKSPAVAEYQLTPFDLINHLAGIINDIRSR